jgi:hypothetical protein
MTGGTKSSGAQYAYTQEEEEKKFYIETGCWKV